MGFCRHCGNIVSGSRCECGGPPVAPAVSFKRAQTSGSQDEWSKAYVFAELFAEPSRLTSTLNGPAIASSTSDMIPSRRFPRPKSTFVSPSWSLNSGITDHITNATTLSTRPRSPLKISTTFSDTENDILPSFLPHEPSLSKVYGSVLQPKDTLTLHSCAICEVVFPPDATIYPNPSSQLNKPSFLCRPCFTSNGGSKGICPSCSRPVLALKSEGAFIQSGGSFWHKRCYNCSGCFKNIGDAPMVDLLGRPSCVDCFDNCLKRDHPATPKKNRITSNNHSPSFSNPGGLNTSYGPGRKSRENSPALDELEERLGLSRSRESSPALIDNNRTLSPRKFTKSGTSQSNSSSDRGCSRPPRPKPRSEDIFNDPSSFDTDKCQNTLSKYPLSDSPIRSSLHRPQENQKAQLTESSCVDLSHADLSPSPPLGNFYSMAASLTHDSHLDSSVTSDVANIPTDSTSTCDKCRKAILNGQEGGQFVTLPGADENSVPRIYHSECFKCVVCDKTFNDSKKGPASFVASRMGPCHSQCALTETLIIHKVTNPKGLPDWAPSIPKDLPTWTSAKLNKVSHPPPTPSDKSQLVPLSPSKPAFPRFGGQTSCPGCRKSVSLMERGVVPGPQGSKWHASCLVCGGKKEISRKALLRRVPRDEKKDTPGCGKKLDSGAKVDGEGGVWCRECLLLLGVGGSPQTSPLKSPMVDSQAKLPPQTTGTLVRQFTGVGGSDAIFRQLTGGGLSPTRSISPTKQLGSIGYGGLRPRPKSALIHVRNTKSVDEGRGMYLVRQMTGSSDAQS
ncbi:hypothetical protein BDN70DRAFT_842224 [Pholiota conissans]|uniref:LIM zinc-binding domain-containing protein n=1 Tax=Pholiota conissans TaxID=109636 RepID=A0A9P5YRE5_9AGAR|nr:hypothetical protein BDN70DRAFT_842224 [Pholiota conissans]